jgi:hypothetical protein
MYQYPLVSPSCLAKGEEPSVGIYIFPIFSEISQKREQGTGFTILEDLIIHFAVSGSRIRELHSGRGQ